MPNNDTSADATSAAADATSTQSQAAGAAADATDSAATGSATDDAAALGDPGKRALDAMKAERDAAKRQAKVEKDRADALETASKTETQQAIDAAKKEGNLEATTKLAGSIRRAEVKAALTAAGINGAVLDLAVRAPEFDGLEVDDDGEVEGLEAAVTAFKNSRKDLFTKAATPGTADGGSRGGAAVTQDQIKAWAKDPAEYEKHRDEIQAWQLQQR